MRWVLGLIGTGIDGRSLPGRHDPPNLWTVPSALAELCYLPGMAQSSAALRRVSEALVAYAKRVRADAERARQNGLQCREHADAARLTAKQWRIHSKAAQDRQDAR
jgi:hypothetical protein